MADTNILEKKNWSQFITEIISKVNENFNWNYRKADGKYFMEILEKYTIQAGSSLLEIETASLALAKRYSEEQHQKRNADYTKMYIPLYDSNNLSGMPFFIKIYKDTSTSDDNPRFYTNIIFNHYNKFFPKVIPRKYMTIIKYLGLVCIHTFSTFDHIIPEFPNNVVHMRFESDMDIYYNVNPVFQFPCYLVSFTDLHKNLGTFDYTPEGQEINYPPEPKKRNFLSSLPSTVKHITTNIILSENLPINLDTAIFHTGIPDLMYLNQYMSSIIIETDLTFPFIQFPYETQYASIGIGHIRGGSNVVISNVRVLEITSFLWNVEYCPVNGYQYDNIDLKKENLVFYKKEKGEQTSNCIHTFYLQKINIFIEEGIEDLIINTIIYDPDYTNFQNKGCEVYKVLNMIQKVSHSFQKLIVKYLDIDIQPWQSIKDNLHTFSSNIQDIIITVMEFEKRFPYITIKFTN